MTTQEQAEAGGRHSHEGAVSWALQSPDTAVTAVSATGKVTPET